MTDLIAMGKAARQASRQLATLTTARKNEALQAIATELETQAEVILAANREDLENGRSQGLSDALLDRLLLTEERLSGLAADTRRIASLPDPVGEEFDSRTLPNGMRICRRRIPIGVLGVIYEARPNVTIDIATLCLKTGNAAILRGGRETLCSNLALVRVIQTALAKTELPETAVQYIDNPDRTLVKQLLRLDQYVDMLIPRGGAALHRLCREESSIPVITGGIGICHIFVDESADLDRALDIIENAKVQRPSVCNALDTLLVHRHIAAEFLPRIAARLATHNVELRATEEAYTTLQNSQHGARVVLAGPDDFDQEWLSLVLGIKIVANVEEAIAHIQAHSTEHTESILTNDWHNATRFVDALTSSAVFVNASTRFNDGGQFGLGAEVAVSTQKLHARGPMGLTELTTYKWIGYGDGHIRS
ncbi:MAG: glutamate-5-semialdehyde dehydrogenase [Chloroflexi bacterium]|nr:MAG: glutamate-5-semialdehyde dehydrogenase [Chloroflexota bacterium]